LPVDSSPHGLEAEAELEADELVPLQLLAEFARRSTKAVAPVKPRRTSSKPIVRVSAYAPPHLVLHAIPHSPADPISNLCSVIASPVSAWHPADRGFLSCCATVAFGARHCRATRPGRACTSARARASPSCTTAAEPCWTRRFRPTADAARTAGRSATHVRPSATHARPSAMPCTAQCHVLHARPHSHAPRLAVAHARPNSSERLKSLPKSCR
jgi:hypothetical protein